MADPNQEPWEQILRDLQARMGGLETRFTGVEAKLEEIGTEVSGLKRMSQMAPGTASGADFVAERAEKLAHETNKRLDARIEALHQKDIHVDA